MGLKLRDYQETAADFLFEHDRTIKLIEQLEKKIELHLAKTE